MNYEKTGLLIGRRRAERGMTQLQLAERLGVSNRTVSKWERGKGFPDVSLLQPLSDELDLSLQALISGEEDAVQNTASIWRAVSFVSQLNSQKIRRLLGKTIGGVILTVVLCFFVFAVLDYSGALLKEIDAVVPAMVYCDGAVVEETTVTVRGTQKTYGKGNDNFVGRFAIACLEKTADDTLSARISWDTVEEGFHEIEYFRSGTEYVNVGIKRYLYISRDMKSFALELIDGRVIATNHALAALEAATPWRYDISYTDFFYSEMN